MESSNLFVELNSVCDAAGSASWAYGNSHVIASIYGPREANIANELTYRASIDLSVIPAFGQHTPNEGEMEAFLSQLIERIIEMKDFPRCQFTVRVQLVSGIVGHPETMAASVNALSLALFQTAIPLKASIVAVCTSELNTDLRPIMLAVDVTHPLLTQPPEIRKKRLDEEDSTSPAIFSIYFGRLSPEASSPVQASVLLHLSSPGRQEDPLVKSLYSRAQDLFTAMLGQITAVSAQA